MSLINSVLTGFSVIVQNLYMVLNEEDKVHEFCGYLKLMTPAYLHDDFSQSIHLSVHHLNGSTDI